MYKKYVCVLVFALLPTIFVDAQMPDSVKNYIDSAIGILKQNALYADNVNWPVIENDVYKKAAAAKTKAQTFEALTIAFNALGDKHAAYYQYNDSYRLTDTVLENRYDDSLKAAWKRGPGLFDTLMGNIGYINVPFMGVTKQNDIDRYANWLYTAVVKLSVRKPAGWIIDLRRNAGGNIRPMMAGLAMFFNSGIVSCCVDRHGNVSDETAISGGNLLIDGKVQAAIENKIAAIPGAKVAVLIGAGTASSGEAVAAIFKQRQNTRLFGEHTAGRGNATNGYVFNDNNSYFLISTAFMGDKNKKALPEFVTPDVIVKGNNAFSNLAADNAVMEAINWLKL